MKIAIIGGGIAGLTAAHLLHRSHQVDLFESRDWLGGHTRTLSVPLQGTDYAIDTGFTLFNDSAYPNFFRLLQRLQVPIRPTEMSFSVYDPHHGREYARQDLNTLFAQRRNLVSPSFWGMLREIIRFNREAAEDLYYQRISDTLTLGNYLHLGSYSQEFIEQYLIPLGASIWSLPRIDLLSFPLLLFMRVLSNRGLLSINQQQRWYVIEGGSNRYVAPLAAGFRQRIRLNCPVWRVDRDERGVTLRSAAGQERYDKVVFACHSDQALKLLTRPSATERAILGAQRYVESEVVLHTDTRLLPRQRRAWSSWNYRLGGGEESPAMVTYNMNLVQGLNAPETFCVSLNQTELIDPRRILARFHYAHPRFSLEGIEAQARCRELLGAQHSYFCGAYWGNGFHEDGVVSALRVAEALGESLEGSSAERLISTPPLYS
ncbi:NAD(P)/FAD-dependent oxidoreductase [Stutzerimonas tarimensis]|uniref:NAD(P)/FAD-dependent oxidoreductase n=1 Tax=Stutzerimonas tarimensis TaxID=1507735 RepID=A0ABV7TA10_9GAMM